MYCVNSNAFDIEIYNMDEFAFWMLQIFQYTFA